MPSDRNDRPPGYAWDWLARQRLVWRDAARRLAARTSDGPHPDVPDWSDLLGVPPDGSADAARARDWSTLRTRSEVIAAMRADYPHDPRVREATDAAVVDLAFLGRLDVPLDARGATAAPRGMRWWWDHVGGATAAGAGGGTGAASASAGRSEAVAEPPLQLRLVDVLSGYGDPDEATTTSVRGTT